MKLKRMNETVLTWDFVQKRGTRRPGEYLPQGLPLICLPRRSLHGSDYAVCLERIRANTTEDARRGMIEVSFDVVFDDVLRNDPVAAELTRLGARWTENGASFSEIESSRINFVQLRFPHGGKHEAFTTAAFRNVMMVLEDLQIRGSDAPYPSMQQKQYVLLPTPTGSRWSDIGHHLWECHQKRTKQAERKD